MDDSQDTLREITTRHAEPIVSLLLKIQEHQELQKDFLSFLGRLECFYVSNNAYANRYKRIILWRRSINAFEERDYVALSYTWDPAPHEDPSSHGYSIQNRKRTSNFPSPVRNCVYERIMKYMHSKRVGLLWIDRHSIPQKTCGLTACTHRECRMKKAGLQCMDWVYKQSKYPVALLGRPITSHFELTLLYDILEGRFVRRSNRAAPLQRLEKRNSPRAADALKLLAAITDDLWWQRAWTFQENYKGGKEMTLLIHHPRSLEGYKRRRKIFGNVPGELCVNSRLFSDEATKLCRAFQYTRRPTRKEEKMIDSILSKAGRYTVLLDGSQTMSPTIVADVEKRGVKDAWDRLAIVGNCCSYPVRMNITRLRQGRHSLSLSMLAMCLLNGEILNNNDDESPDEHMAFDMTGSGFLKAQSFDKMSSPLEQRSLTFNKGSRFIGVELSQSGIITRGHLWELGEIIPTAHFRDELPWIEYPQGDLSLLEQKYLTKLFLELKSSTESRSLARCIESYLDGDAIDRAAFRIGENYMRMMMVEVANAIEEGMTLRLGRLRGSDEYMAIFIWEGDDNPGFVFTSSRTRNPNSEAQANDTDRHISLEVNLRPGTGRTGRGPPHLYVKHWVSGICFFVGRPWKQVVFPWPSVLKNMDS
ncbi:hypothetical protein ANO14919_129020 [Xylariales sp. No.14919]|nr:hypothetical protein ANO14919_129020 [Xylariales sp. No.14919]